MSDEKQMVTDHVEVLLADNGNMEYELFMDTLNDMRSRNSHKSYSKFFVSLNKDDSGYALLLDGEREETSEEFAVRKAGEERSRKNVEAAELKEYLRLKKKYGKSQ